MISGNPIPLQSSNQPSQQVIECSLYGIFFSNDKKLKSFLSFLSEINGAQPVDIHQYEYIYPAETSQLHLIHNMQGEETQQPTGNSPKADWVLKYYSMGFVKKQLMVNSRAMVLTKTSDNLDLFLRLSGYRRSFIIKKRGMLFNNLKNGIITRIYRLTECAQDEKSSTRINIFTQEEMEGWSGEFDDYWCVDLVGTCSNEQAETFALQMLQFSKKYSSFVQIRKANY